MKVILQTNESTKIFLIYKSHFQRHLKLEIRQEKQVNFISKDRNLLEKENKNLFSYLKKNTNSLLEMTNTYHKIKTDNIQYFLLKINISFCFYKQGQV